MSANPQCPKCHTHMTFHMDYFAGNPYIFYICPACGYDTRNERTYATSNTEFRNHIVSTNNTNSCTKNERQ